MKKLFILLLFIYVSDAFILPLTKIQSNKVRLINTNIKKKININMQFKKE